jgi:D-threo-aldose 1-dehydrogenase
MDITKRKIGKTETVVTELGVGCAGLGDLFDLLSEQQAQQTLQAAWDAGIRYYDTAPFYGYGKSEHRLGHFLRQQPRNDFVVSTKVGRVLKPTRNHETFDGGFWRGGLPFDFVWDYSYDGIMRSYEDSLQRLSLSCIDLLLIHDLDSGNFPTEALLNAHLYELATSGWRALDELRSSGAIKAIGAGINISGMIPRVLDVVDLDMFLVAMPYTLLDQGVLEEEFPRCAESDVGIVIGAVFASGILASGPVEGARYAYAPASEEILEKTRRIEEICKRNNTPLGAAAMQFPLAHPLVASIIPGALEPGHVEANVGLFRHEIPSALWAELKEEGLMREDAPIPGAHAV